MDWTAQQSFVLASESAKQLMSLAVAILAISAASRVISQKAPRLLRVGIAVSWTLYALSFLCGTWFMLALTAILTPVSTDAGEEIGQLIAAPRVVVSAGPQRQFTLQARPRDVIFSIDRDKFGREVVHVKPFAWPNIWEEPLQTAMALEILTFVAGTLIIVVVFIAGMFTGHNRLRPRLGRYAKWRATMEADRPPRNAMDSLEHHEAANDQLGIQSPS